MGLRTRDALWLTILALILAAWGWDRGRLAVQLDALNAPPWRMRTPGVVDAPILGLDAPDATPMPGP